MTWKKFSGEVIHAPILEEIENAIIRESEKGYKLKVCIGTDSQVKGSITDFATVIVLLREHHGGFMYIHQEKSTQQVSIKERMLMEVQKSIETAYAVCDLLDLYEVGLEVHADINTNPSFKSNKALNDAMGYILSMGFIFKAKPEAFASSTCADKMVH
ncbi:ribonuclease H-like YkuK family protein [Pedobacter endophyticus]|uniref:Ribonuclease H-like YkuK family protein n=1 Tax=Pedobacter endophyticus TaxID=2789740 RepID=A0A7S9KYM3_9SPHI|nr:ribonuclease H-like YkuK family protein [Pedobacter endophyticus]QPH39268.1 ribonuclease H-like YkuK family protein [Pedobacter endophyticus]